MARNNEEFRKLAGLSGNLTESMSHIPVVGGRDSGYNQRVQETLNEMAEIEFDLIEDVNQVEKMVEMLEGFDVARLAGDTRKEYEETLEQLKDIVEGMRRIKSVSRTGKVSTMKRRSVIPGAERMANKKRARKNRTKAKIYRQKMARKVDRGERKRSMLQKESFAGKLDMAIKETDTLSGNEEIMKRVRNVFSMINFLAEDSAVTEKLDSLWEEFEGGLVEGISDREAEKHYTKVLTVVKISLQELGLGF